MPEGDAVRRTAIRLDRALAGRALTATDFRVPQLATADLAGAVVHGTHTHGKHLFTRLASETAGDCTLHTHLKMEGEWRTYRPDARWDRPGHLARVVLRTADSAAVGFALGIVDLIATDAEVTVTHRLGPDLLGTDWSGAAAAERLLRQRARPLAEALLDQQVVAGLGTIYVAEACFVHGVHPLTPVADVADPQRLLDRARAMLRLGVEQGRPVTTGDRRAPMWVYRRQRQPCRRCGTTIAAGDVGPAGRVRTTYWCPGCQPPI